MQNGAGILTLTRLVALIVVTIFCGITCDDPPSGPGIVIDKPVIEPVPGHQAVDVSNRPILIWPSANTFDQTARYELYLDTVNPPTLYAVNLTDTVFEPDFLEPGWTYYWRVVTKGVRRGFPVSPLWSFTTRSITYPVAVGNRWDYEIAFWYERIRPDSLAPFIDGPYASVATVEVAERIDFPGPEPIFRFHKTFLGPFNRCEEDEYYRATTDGLYSVSSSAPCGTMISPKTGRSLSIKFEGQFFSSVEEIIGYVSQRGNTLVSLGQDDGGPHLCYKYPLRIGQQWTYIEQSDAHFWRIDRRVVDWRMISTPAGDFDCFVVQWLFDINRDGEWDDNLEFFDFVAAEGLVKRMYTLRDLDISRPASPDSIGTYDAVWEATLTDFHLDRR